MNGQFLRIGSQVYNVNAIACVDLQHARPHNAGGGTNVRIWLQNPGAVVVPAGGNSGDQMPAYIDVTGQEAQRLRAWFTRAETTGLVTSITPGGGDEPATSSATAKPATRARAAGAR